MDVGVTGGGYGQGSRDGAAPAQPLILTLHGKRTAEATFSMARFLMLGVREPRQVGQRLSCCRHCLHTRCPAWHCRMGGST